MPHLCCETTNMPPALFIFYLTYLLSNRHVHIGFKAKFYGAKKQRAKILAALLMFGYGFSFGNGRADFSVNKSAGCPPLLVNFTNLSSPGVTCNWDFGNGNNSTLFNPSAAFENPGIYRVTLVVTNGSQTDSFSKTIVVFTPPTANFTANKTSACSGDSGIIRFQNQAIAGSAPIINYTWGFGIGTASDSENASYQYSHPGAYNITLVVRDSNQCSANKTIPAYIQIYPLPLVSFTASPQNSCTSPQTVQFSNTSNGIGLNYLWTLDINITSTLQNPVYTYTEQSFMVQLAVTDTNGCKNFASEHITALQLHAGFIASDTHPCTGQSITFRNTSDLTGTQWYWDFGDGTTSTENNPAKVYNSTGTYTVNFIINDGNCGDSIKRTAYITVISGFPVNMASFSAEPTYSCRPPLSVNFQNITPGVNQSQYSYFWNFGDDSTSNLQNPTTVYHHAGNYTVNLTITNSSGCIITGSVTNYIIIGQPVPRASIDTLDCPGAPVSFLSQSLYTSSVLWKFGDGDSSAIPQTTHVYNHSGYYTITLTAYNMSGCDSTIVLHNFVHIQTISSDFTVLDSFSTCPPFIAGFSNLTPYQGNRFLWDFGDGYTDITYNPTHIYFNPGVYTVKLITTWSGGHCTDTVTHANIITVQGPYGTFTESAIGGCAPVTVTFGASVSANTKTISCDLGDGTLISDSTNFDHIYLQPGSYNPVFILTDFVGCRVAYPLRSIDVHSLPVVNSFDTSVCPGSGVQVSFAASPNTYNWAPSGSISCDTCAEVTLYPLQSTLYTVTATSIIECQNTAAINVFIKLPPVLNDSVQFTLCPHDTCSLFVGNATKFRWWPALYLSDTNAISPLCTPLTSTLYTVSAWDSNGCVATAQVHINIKDKIGITLPDSVLACPERGVVLQPALTGNYRDPVQYSWSPAQYLNSSDILNPVATIYDSAVQFQLIAANGHCMADTERLTVYPDVPIIQVSPAVTVNPYVLVSFYAASSEILSFNKGPGHSNGICRG